MELNFFIKELEDGLVKRGISPDVADKHVHTLRRTFTEDDLKEIQSIQSADEVDEIAESIAQLLKKNKIKAHTPPTEEQSTPTEQTAQPQSRASEYPPQTKSVSSSEKDERLPSRPAKKTKPQPASYEWDEDEYYEEDEKGSGKGFYIFWLVFIFTLPVTIALGAAFFGAFVGIFAALSALIVGLIAGLIGLVAVGAGVSLVGIIFGITQLFSFVSAGIYEIGLGVMVIGVVMLAGILIYNFAIRFLPWLIRKVWTLLTFTCGKIRDLFHYLRRECYKL